MRTILTNLIMLIRSIRLGITISIAHYKAYQSQSRLAEKALKQLDAIYKKKEREDNRHFGGC